MAALFTAVLRKLQSGAFPPRYSIRILRVFRMPHQHLLHLGVVARARDEEGRAEERVKRVYLHPLLDEPLDDVLRVQLRRDVQRRLAVDVSSALAVEAARGRGMGGVGFEAGVRSMKEAFGATRAW